MKLKEAIERLDRSAQNDCYASVEPFAQALGMNAWWLDGFDERVKGYYVLRWLCTDTWVGIRAYFMDDELVAVSFQAARKNDEELDFVSEEAAIKVRGYIQELLNKAADKPAINALDMELDGTFWMDYAEKLCWK